MPRLYRPHIPLEVRCRVVLRQLGELWPDETIEAYKPRPGDAYLKGLGVNTFLRPGLAFLLKVKLGALAEFLDCKVEDLRLDHDPALATRMKRTLLSGKMIYSPAANDPEHLIYREKHAHHIKTNVRGDGAQHPDRVLIKRERKRLAGPKKSLKTRWKMPKRKLRSASRWPTGRKINRRVK